MVAEPEGRKAPSAQGAADPMSRVHDDDRSLLTLTERSHL